MLYILILIHTCLSFPVIGIISQPSLIPGFRQYNYIASSYVKMIEASGAQVAHIPFDAPLATLKLIFSNINGILIPGGGTGLDRNSTYTTSASYLLKLALKSNDKGVYFPVMGICLGHELIHYYLSQFNEQYRVPVFGQDMVTRPLKIVGKSPIFLSFDNQTRHIALTESIFYYHHEKAVPIELYKLETIKSNLTIVAIDEDTNGTVFVTAAVGIKYPILTSQYHPEKNPFEWTVPANHSREAIEISQIHGNIFVQMARKNTHLFQLDEYLIYNYETIIPQNLIYNEVYLFNKHQL